MQEGCAPATLPPMTAAEELCPAGGWEAEATSKPAGDPLGV